METNTIQVINTFKSNLKSSHTKSPEQRVNDQIAEMCRLADSYNFDDRQVKLYFFGDGKSGLQFRVECADNETMARLTNVLRLYLKNRN